MADNPYDNYWMSAIIFIGYLIFSCLIYLCLQTINLKKRGEKIMVYVIEKTTHAVTGRGAGGTAYNVKYKFTFKNIEYHGSSSLSKGLWETLIINTSEMEITFDPHNPTINVPCSEMNSQFCGIVVMMILSIGWILVPWVPVLYSEGVKWYHCVVIIFLIPVSGLILLLLFGYICDKICYRKKEKNQQSTNYDNEEQEQEQTGLNNSNN
eukprot:424619_1